MSAAHDVWTVGFQALCIPFLAELPAHAIFPFFHCLHAVGHSSLYVAAAEVDLLTHDCCEPHIEASLHLTHGTLAMAMDICEGAPHSGVGLFCAIGAYMTWCVHSVGASA